MQYVIIAIVILAIIVISMYVKNNSQKTSMVSCTSNDNAHVTDELTIAVEQLPIERLPDESNLIEVTDKELLARIDNLVPGLVQSGVATANAIEAAGNTVYRAIIPVGAKLTNSKTMEGAVRGIYHGADGIKGHANLVAIERTGSTIANTSAAAMGIASMIVGQYYMTQINAKLSKISDGLEKISSFQENEYKSKVFALMSQVKKISSFQSEILQNQTLRNAELNHLNTLEDQCIELLGQANLSIADLSAKEDLDYSAYEIAVHEAQNWYVYQQVLQEILIRISDLKYTLNLGEISREQCISLLPTYIKQSTEAREKLQEWHNANVSRLAIDTSKSQRKRQGLDSAIHWIPGLIDDIHNYASIENKTVEMIEIQRTPIDYTSHINTSELYRQDVSLISKNGKMYYYPTQE